MKIETLKYCCGLGANYANSGLKCISFQTPIAGVQKEDELSCLNSIDVCCKNQYRYLYNCNNIYIWNKTDIVAERRYAIWGRTTPRREKRAKVPTIPQEAIWKKYENEQNFTKALKDQCNVFLFNFFFAYIKISR